MAHNLFLLHHGKHNTTGKICTLFPHCTFICKDISKCAEFYGCKFVVKYISAINKQAIMAAN